MTQQRGMDIMLKAFGIDMNAYQQTIEMMANFVTEVRERFDRIDATLTEMQHRINQIEAGQLLILDARATETMLLQQDSPIFINGIEDNQ